MPDSLCLVTAGQNFQRCPAFLDLQLLPHQPPEISCCSHSTWGHSAQLSAVLGFTDGPNATSLDTVTPSPGSISECFVFRSQHQFSCFCFGFPSCLGWAEVEHWPCSICVAWMFAVRGVVPCQKRPAAQRVDLLLRQPCKQSQCSARQPLPPCFSFFQDQAELSGWYSASMKSIYGSPALDLLRTFFLSCSAPAPAFLSP